MAFDTDTYMANKLAQLNRDQEGGKSWTMADVQKAFAENGLTPEQHYEKFGKSEGVSPEKAKSSTFNTDTYLQNKTNQLNRIKQDGRSDWTVADTLNAIAENGMTAQEHAQRHGLNEGVYGYSSNKGFDTDAYLQNKTNQVNQIQQDGRSNWTVDEVTREMAKYGMNPLDHYIQFGMSEGVSPLGKEADENVQYDKLLAALKNGLGIDQFIDMTKTELNSIKDQLRSPVTQKENPDGFQNGYGYDNKSENWIDGNGNQNEKVKPSWLSGYGTFQAPQMQDWMSVFNGQGYGTFSPTSEPTLDNLLSFSNLFNYAQSVPKAEIDPGNKLAELQSKINDAVNNGQISSSKAQEILDALQKNTDLVNRMYEEYGSGPKKGAGLSDRGENGGGANLN